MSKPIYFVTLQLCCAWLALGCYPHDADDGFDKAQLDVRDLAGIENAPVGSNGLLAAANEEFQVPEPPFSEKIFPCSRCHSVLPPNFVKRKLEKEHQQIKLEHGVRERWCFDCHIQEHRDKLRMASGGTVSFRESYKLCGQCHGTKLRDWRLGVHGKRTGYWNGAKQYLLCVHCHNPHSPRFKPLKPEPPPTRPADLRI